jgi:hypothetical protein
MIAVWIALSIVFTAGSLMIVVSAGVRQADRKDLVIQPSTPLALLARRVLRSYVRKDGSVQSAEAAAESSNWAAA